MKLISGPMATVSHEAFRRTVESFGGCDEYFTEMINAGSLLDRGPFEKFYLLNGPCPEKLVWQLTGNKTDTLARAATVVSEIGGLGVDMNMGCSAPQIAKSGAGISWMLKPINETTELVHKLKASIENAAKEGTAPLRFSVKIRLGDEDFTPEGLFAFTDMLCAEGVQLITLHPRTKKEKYRGFCRWEYVQELAERLKDKGVSVYLNGDVKDLASLNKALNTAPLAQGIMISRAAAQQPWIFSELKAGLLPADSPLKADQQIDFLQLGLDYIDAVEQFQPPEFHKTRLQRFFSYYCQNFTFGHYANTQMQNAVSNEDSRQRLTDYFVKQPSDRYRTKCLLLTKAL